MTTRTEYRDPTLADSGRVYFVAWLDAVPQSERERLRPAGVDADDDAWPMLGLSLGRWVGRLESSGVPVESVVSIGEWTHPGQVAQALSCVLRLPAVTPLEWHGGATSERRHELGPGHFTWAICRKPVTARDSLVAKPVRFGSEGSAVALVYGDHAAGSTSPCTALLVETRHAATVCALVQNSQPRAASRGRPCVQAGRPARDAAARAPACVAGRGARRPAARVRGGMAVSVPGWDAWLGRECPSCKAPPGYDCKPDRGDGLIHGQRTEGPRYPFGPPSDEQIEADRMRRAACRAVNAKPTSEPRVEPVQLDLLG